MAAIFKKVAYKFAKTFLSFKSYTKFHFYNQHGYRLDLKTPKTLNEKIQWIKLYGDLESLSNYVDKYEVREYVRNKIGDEYLIPLIGVYENSNEIDFETLPKSFVIKATHASGWNLIVKDKELIDWSGEKKKIDEWTSSSFYEVTGERNYKLIEGRVVVEELIEDPSGDLKDYKIFCFNGEPSFIQVDGDRYDEHKRDLYDTDWNKLPVTYHHPNLRKVVAKPERLDELLEIARSLSSDFKFVRVDLYHTDNEIYFGELTYTPCQGFEKFTPSHFDADFGSNWELDGSSLIK